MIKIWVYISSTFITKITSNFIIFGSHPWIRPILSAFKPLAWILLGTRISRRSYPPHPRGRRFTISSAGGTSVVIIFFIQLNLNKKYKIMLGKLNSLKVSRKNFTQNQKMRMKSETKNKMKPLLY